MLNKLLYIGVLLFSLQGVVVGASSSSGAAEKKESIAYLETTLHFPFTPLKGLKIPIEQVQISKLLRSQQFTWKKGKVALDERGAFKAQEIDLEQGNITIDSIVKEYDPDVKFGDATMHYNKRIITMSFQYFPPKKGLQKLENIYQAYWDSVYLQPLFYGDLILPSGRLLLFAPIFDDQWHLLSEKLQGVKQGAVEEKEDRPPIESGLTRKERALSLPSLRKNVFQKIVNVCSQSSELSEQQGTDFLDMGISTIHPLGGSLFSAPVHDSPYRSLREAQSDSRTHQGGKGSDIHVEDKSPVGPSFPIVVAREQVEQEPLGWGQYLSSLVLFFFSVGVVVAIALWRLYVLSIEWDEEDEEPLYLEGAVEDEVLSSYAN